MGDPFVNYWVLYSELIDKLVAHKDYDEAVLCAERLTVCYPGLALAWLRYAELLLKANQFDRADRAFERALVLDSKHPELALSYARRLKDKKEFLKALELTEEVCERRPDWEIAAAFHCELLGLSGRHDEAKQFAADFLKRLPASPEVGLALLKIYYESNDPGAKDLFIQYLNSPTENLALFGRLVETLKECGRYDEVLQVTERTRADGRLTVEIARACAAASEAKGDVAGAEQLLERILTANPSEDVGRDARRLIRARRGGTRSKHVVMISVRPRIREAKLARALKLSGWSVSLIYAYESNYNLLDFFDEVSKYTTPEHALLLAEKARAPIHHIFSLRGDHVAAAFVREKPAFTIFDVSDIFDGLVYGDFEFHTGQRYCLQNADALVCRDLNPGYATKRTGFRRPKHVLYYPEYCWGDSPTEHPRRGDEIHVAQIGWVDLERVSGMKNGNCLDVVEALAKDRVHCHIYQHLFTQDVSLEELYKDFISLGKETGFVHVHPNIPLTEVVPTLERYDFGMLTVLPQEGPIKEGFQRLMHPLLLRGCSAARCTDYIDAGLPIILSTELVQQTRMNRLYGINVPLSGDLLRNPRKVLEPFCDPNVRREIRRKSRRFSIAEQAPRLIRFYERCLREA